MLELLFVLCEFLQNPSDIAKCMVDIHTCAVHQLKEYPDRSYEERVDVCAETIPFEESPW